MKRQIPALLGLYIHWPYCSHICPYCDFNVRRDRGRDTDFLVDAIIADITGNALRIDEPRALTSLAFGGGTPSRLQASQISRILDAAEREFGFLPDIEISLEANPADNQGDCFRDFAALGINRLSLGIQSLNAQELQFLGRDHSPEEARRALDAAAKHFSSVSADFIYGLPEQQPHHWQKSLQEIMALGLEHLSLYCLSIEPRTVFAKRHKQGLLTPLEDDLVADLYQCAQNMTAEHRMNAYETSNHAASISARSVHNLLYWQGDDWIGVGPGAHGRLSIQGQRQELATYCRPQDYAKAVSENGWGIQVQNALTPLEDLAERIVLGLRLRDGIHLEQLQDRAGASVSRKNLNELVAGEFLRLNNHYLQATEPLLVDRIASELLC